jgi:AraC family mar-sox-rob regulon transcriptional activator
MERPHLAVIRTTRTNPAVINQAAVNQTAVHQAVINPTPPPDKPRHFALSRTTDRVLQILLGGDLARLRADSVAESLGMSSTTLRRRLRADHTCYQFLLDRARQYRCEQQLRETWLPGKCLADELGYLEVNSFYRAFRRWTGLSYSQYKLRHC